MKVIVASLLESYERGKVSRRQLIQRLAAIAASAHTVPAFGSTFQGVGLNHIAVRVTNVQRSRDFYQKHLGTPVIHESETNCFLGLGKKLPDAFPEPDCGAGPFLHRDPKLQRRCGHGRPEAAGPQSQPAERDGPRLLP